MVQKVATEISNGVLQGKYKLGYRATDATRRFVTEVARYKVNNGVADSGGLPYATHYVYTNDAVNNSIGTDTESDGWTSYGTMIRIPTNYLLEEKDETDKYGNALYEWETHDVAVYAHKGGSESKSVAYYVIWDEAGDDLHYRIIHETMGF